MLPLEKFNYEELQKIYSEYFSLSYLNTSIDNKFGLISLVCYLTNKIRMKHPDTTCYSVLMKIIEKDIHKYNVPFIEHLSIICEDFMKYTTNFMNFNLKTKSEIVSKIREILDTWVPF